MIFEIHRVYDNKNMTASVSFIDGVEECWILEDQFQKIKVPGETRIPPGKYKAKLRTHGRLHNKYKNLFPWHKGMIELEGVPGFTDILFHIGTRHQDTRGCIMPGEYIGIHSGKFDLKNSTAAYKKSYKKMIPFIDDLHFIIK